MNKSRAKSTIINIIVIVVMQILNLIYSLISKNLFLNEFSLSVYGVVDLFGSFFQSLMLLELGFGTILIYNLYKPLSNNNDKEIRKQLSIFKTIYFYLILIIVGISIVLAPFLYDIFNISYNDMVLVYEIYFSNILYIIIKYWTLNKISIISAGQEKYIENIIILAFDFVSFAIRVICVVIFKDIYLYIFAQLVIPSFAYLVEVLWINKHYSVKGIKFVSFSEIRKSGVLKQCVNYIYATIYSLVFVSMDNMIISSILSTDAVAYVTNYNSLLLTGGQFIVMVMVSLRGIIANYHYTEQNKEGYFGVFSIVSSINFMIVSLMIVGFYVMMDDFITIWLGKEYVIVSDIFISMLIIRMLEAIFEPINSIFIIDGYIFKEKIPLIISALVNFVFTIIFINGIGLIGAYVATIIALIIKWSSKMYYVIKYTFNTYKFRIIKKYISYIVAIFFEMYLIKTISITFIPDVTGILPFMKKMLVVVVLCSILNSMIIMIDKETRTYIINSIRSLI